MSVISTNVTLNQTTIQSFTWPVTIQYPSNPSSNYEIKISVSEDLTFKDNSWYFIINHNVVNFIFDGNYGTNLNCKIKYTSSNSQQLFQNKSLSSNITIKNIIIPSDTKDLVNNKSKSFIIDYNYGLIENILTQKIIYTNSAQICTNNYGIIKNCECTGDIAGNYSASICIYNVLGTIESCKASGKITGKYSAGLIYKNGDYVNSPIVKNCSSTQTASTSYTSLFIYHNYATINEESIGSYDLILNNNVKSSVFVYNNYGTIKDIIFSGLNLNLSLNADESSVICYENKSEGIIENSFITHVKIYGNYSSIICYINNGIVQNVNNIDPINPFVYLYGDKSCGFISNNYNLITDCEFTTISTYSNASPIAYICIYNYGNIQNFKCTHECQDANPIVQSAILNNYNIIDNCTFHMINQWKANESGMIYLNYGTIKNCVVDIDECMGSNNGGLIYNNQNGGTVETCTVTVCITSSYIGSLFYSNSGSINDCISNSFLNESSENTLKNVGIFGYKNYGTIINCNLPYPKPNIYGNYISFILFNSGTIEQCFMTAKTSGTPINIYAYYFGGICFENGGLIKNCYCSDIKITEVQYSAGFVNRHFGGSIEQCYFNGIILYVSSCGGLVYDNRAKIYNCYVNISQSDNYVSSSGGLGYSNITDDVTYCYVVPFRLTSSNGSDTYFFSQEELELDTRTLSSSLPWNDSNANLSLQGVGDTVWNASGNNTPYTLKIFSQN